MNALTDVGWIAEVGVKCVVRSWMDVGMDV
jgi:hypothetical protein